MDEVLKACNTIKKYCNEHACPKCIFFSGHLSFPHKMCVLVSNNEIIPGDWDMRKIRTLNQNDKNNSGY